MKKVAIIQSNYIPWKGYFDIIGQVDEFIFYDTAIYTARSWRNRNGIKTPSGVQWLVIPVHHDYQSPKPICDIQVVDQHWRKKHWKNLVQHYARAPFFKDYKEALESLYLDYEDRYLSEINYRFNSAICEMLSIPTKLTLLCDYEMTGDKSEDLIRLCRQISATTYLSGPVAQDFLEKQKFNSAGIALEWMSYDHYSEYPQFYPPFVHQVSILDLLFHTGKNARSYLSSHLSSAQS